jgi:hypothetical protein
MNDFWHQHTAVMKKLNDKSNRALLKAGQYLESKLKSMVAQESYDLWTYAGSINTQLVRTGLVIVGTNVVYAPSIEYGRKPGKFPPLQPLKERAWRKLGDENLGFVVARKIAEEWIEAKPIFATVREKEEKNVRNIYHKNMRND